MNSQTMNIPRFETINIHRFETMNIYDLEQILLQPSEKRTTERGARYGAGDPILYWGPDVRIPYW